MSKASTVRCLIAACALLLTVVQGDSIQPAGAQTILHDLGILQKTKPARRTPRPIRARPAAEPVALPVEGRQELSVPLPKPNPRRAGVGQERKVSDRNPPEVATSEPLPPVTSPSLDTARPPTDVLPRPRPSDGSAADSVGDTGSPAAPGGFPTGKEVPDRPVPAPPEPINQLPDEEVLCLDKLKTMGVIMRPLPAIRDPAGCTIERPLELTALGDGVKLAVPARLACPMAEALARWSARVLVPDAQAILNARPVLLDLGSGYQCRPRNGQAGAKLSEHGIGNAIDIGAIRLDSGTSVSVVVPAEEAIDETTVRRLRFLRSIRAGACSIFTTVLGPGADAYHGEHFHFDMAVRKNGYKMCQ